MAVFAYKICSAAGEILSGTLSADTPAAGRRMLRAQGMQIIAFEAVRFQIQWSVLRLRFRRRSVEDVAEFARQLSLLIRSGVNVVDALDVLIEQKSGRLVKVLRDVREKVAGGATLTTALERHPDWFDNVLCSAVRVGQASGNLDRALRELSDHLRERSALRNRVVEALAYPFILSIVGIGVVLFLMSYVVPQLLTVLEASGRPLPASTKVLKGGSDLLVQHWLMLAIVVLFLVTCFVFLHRHPAVRLSIHQTSLRLPAVGMLLRKSAVAQFAQVMSMLLRSGVSFVDGLRLMRSTVRNEVLKGELALMEAAVERGSDIAPTMQGSKVFPPLVAHLVHVGQTTGELVEMLAELRQGYEAEVRLAVGRATAVLEPLMIVVMASLIGFVVFATMMPLLEIMRTIH